MTANKQSDAITEVMKRRIKELERDGYNEDFLRCFRNAIKQLETLHGLNQLQHESEELGLYDEADIVTTRIDWKSLEVARMIRDHQKIIDTKRKSCPKCYGTGAVDAPTSADDPSCPECDGEGTWAK